MARLDTAPVADPPGSYVDDGGPRPTARWGVLGVRADLLDASEAYAAALLANTGLSPRHRSLALLAVTRRSEYEQSIHRARARDVGLGDAEFEAVESEDWTAECLDESDRAVFRFAMMFDAGHGMGDSVFDRLREYLDEAQIIELCATCAHAGGLARLAIALELTADAGA